MVVASKSFSSKHFLYTQFESALTKQIFYLLVEPENKKKIFFMIT